MIGVGMLAATAFAPHATWPLWLTPATLVVWGRSSSFSASMRGGPRADITIQAAEVGGTKTMTARRARSLRWANGPLMARRSHNYLP